MEEESKGEHGDKACPADTERHAHLRERPQAERGEEFRSGAVADGEHEKAEENRAEERRNDKVSELSEDDGDDQNARRRTERKALEPDATKDRPDRHRQQN